MTIPRPSDVVSLPARLHGSGTALAAMDRVLRLLDDLDPEGFHAAAGPVDKYAAAAVGLTGAARSGRLDQARLLAVWTFWFGEPTQVALWSPQERDDLSGRVRDAVAGTVATGTDEVYERRSA